MKQGKSKRKKQRSWWRQQMAVGAAIVMVLLFSGTALAAEVLSGDPYILPRGEVIHDDLYVTGSEVIIDGTVEGDVVVAAGYVEINGVVMGDLLATGGAVIITGNVQDDVRAAGGAVIHSGSVGDDFFAAAGGGWPGMVSLPIMTMQLGNRSVPQGLQINAGSTIGGDAYVAGGQGTIAGSIGSNLMAGMGNLTFGGKVAGDANLNAQSLTVLDGAVVQGELRYSTSGNTQIPAGVAASVVEQPVNDNAAAPKPNPIWGFFRWLLRTVLILAGYLLVGWLLWAFAPRQITGPVAVLETRPMEAGIIGLLAVVAVVPVGAALTFLAVLFWGWFPGGAILLTFVFGLVGLLWLLGPIIVGLWIGRRLAHLTGAMQGELPHLLLGIALIVLVARVLTVIPCIGDLIFQVIFLASLALSVGSWFLARRRPPQEPALLPAPVVPAI
jgi:cytoskeletal protein CcmA (bactofilin family)